MLGNICMLLLCSLCRLLLEPTLSNSVAARWPEYKGFGLCWEAKEKALKSFQLLKPLSILPEVKPSTNPIGALKVLRKPQAQSCSETWGAWEMSFGRLDFEEQHHTGVCPVFRLGFTYSNPEQMSKLFGQRVRERKGCYSSLLHTDAMTRLSCVPPSDSSGQLADGYSYGQTAGLVSWVTLG